MPMRRLSAGTWTDALPTTSPAIRISPAVAGSSPATARNRVVLPQPDGPISTPMSPAAIPNDTSATAGWGRLAYCTRSWETSTNMGLILDAYNSHLHQRALRPPCPMPLRRLQTVLLLLLAAVLVLPVLAVLASWLQSTGQSVQILGEMSRTVLPGYIWTTLWLCLSVGTGVALVGMASAAAVTLFDFPGRRFFEW